MTTEATNTGVSDTSAPGASALLYSNGQPISPEAAAEKRAGLMADERYCAAALSDPAKQKELADLYMLARGQQPGAVAKSPTNAADVVEQMGARELADREARIAAFLKVADLPPAVVDQIRLQTPVSTEERQMALREITRLKADRGFVRALMDGDRAARTRWTLVNIILGSPVAAEQRR